MYNKGDLKVTDPLCDEALEIEGEVCCYEDGHKHHRKDERPEAYLPHSCDEWVIGSIAEIAAMIEDLQAAKLVIEQQQEVKQ